MAKDVKRSKRAGYSKRESVKVQARLGEIEDSLFKITRLVESPRIGESTRCYLESRAKELRQEASRLGKVERAASWI